MNAKFIYHPVYEFFISFYVFSDKRAHKKMELGMHWVNEIKPALSEDFLQIVSKKETRTKVVVLQYYLLSQLIDEQMNIQSILTQIEKEDMKTLITPAYESPEFKEQIPPDVKDILPILKEWYTVYFSTVDEKILNNLQTSAINAELVLETKNVIEVVEQLTNGIILPENRSRELVLIPQYHYSPIVLHDKTEKQQILFYPVDAKPIAEDQPSLMLMRKLRALSDENRLKILKYLALEDRTFSAIQKQIGLAKSTVHHHLIILRSAGLLSLVVSEQKQDHYRFRKEGYRGLEHLLNSFLINR